MAERATSATAVGREACRHALGRLGESLAMRETVAILGDIDEAGWNVVRTVMRTTGPSIVDALTTLVAVEHDTPGSARAAELIVAFGKPSVSRLGGLVGDSRWVAQRAGARLLGAIASADGVPLLQPLLRKGDPRVTREAVTALSRIDDPSAARAIQTVLRASSGATRQAVIDALVADRDERVVPMLVRVIGESDSFGKDYEVVLETMEALATVGSDQATPALVSVARQRRWYARRKTRALKEKAVDGLARIGGPNALQAIDEAGRTGDRLLQKIVQQRRPAAARAERRAVGDAGA
jgi:HEAT repeat protein